jgi:hypothetical protein
MTIGKRLPLSLIGLFALALHGCGGGGEKSGADPKIRLLNLSTGYTALDMMTNLDADTDDDDETQATGVALETVSDYATIDPDDYTVKVRRTGSGSVLRSFAARNWSKTPSTLMSLMAKWEISERCASTTRWMKPMRAKTN